MYAKYWGLKKKPFELGCDPDFFYDGDAHLSVLLKLRYTMENRRGSALFVGARGTGKSMIAATLARLGENGGGLGPFVFARTPFLKAEDATTYLADVFEDFDRKSGKVCADPFLELEKRTSFVKGTSGFYRAFSKIEQFLIRNAENNRCAVLCLEDFHLTTDPGILATLKSFIEIQYQCRPALSLLLITPSLNGLAPQTARFVDDYIETRAELTALSRQETERYILHRLKIAGSTREIFASEAFPLIYEGTGGIPRKINRVCDLALLVGYAEQLTQIDSDVLQSLSREQVAI